MEKTKQINQSDKLSLFEFDKGFNKELLCGVDEAGRGPLAGDCYAACVVLPKNCVIEGLNDSKKISEKKRNELYEKIIENALYYNIGIATVEEIEKINILNSAMLAMKRAVEGIPITPDLVIVDGNKIPNINVPCKSIIKGDSISASVAAASILAKVQRDRYMIRMDEKYPGYEFKKHKGYGTKLHYDLIREHGICEIHRKSFLKKMKEKDEALTLTKKIGDAGEAAAAKYLIKKGFTIITTKYQTKRGEIDIIAKKDDIYHFVEVKSRTSLDVPAQTAVCYKKRKRVILTSEDYIQENNITNNSCYSIIEVLFIDKKIYVHLIENAFLKDG